MRNLLQRIRYTMTYPVPAFSRSLTGILGASLALASYGCAPHHPAAEPATLEIGRLAVRKTMATGTRTAGAGKRRAFRAPKS